MTRDADTAAIVDGTPPAPAVETGEESVDRGVPDRGHVTALVGLADVLAYAALGAAVAFALPIATLVLLAATQLADVLVLRNPHMRAVLARAQFGMPARSLTRELAVALLVDAEPWAGAGTRHVAAVLVLGLAGLRLVYHLLLVPVRRRTTLPVEARNVGLQGLRLPVVPHPEMANQVSERSHAVTLVGLLGATLAVVLSSPPLAFAVLGVVLAAEVAAVGVMLRVLVANRRVLPRERFVAEMRRRVDALGPEVLVYHSGNPNSAYQVNMWLATLERSRRPAVVVLRERTMLAELVPTTLPVLCIPDPVDFMTFGLRDVRVALYTANVGKTIHMLREPGVTHCFIGHGDSDKTASFNPFSKVYTEIWVAGPAGRERYQRAHLGIHDDDIREVGRPQLVGIEGPRTRTGILTVLYAPTWEGWTNDPTATSLLRTGPRLVERLLRRPDVRVVYKPHPLTGTVSPVARRSHERIRAMVHAAAGDGRGHAVVEGPEPALYECFNDADVLVSDISSVLSDFVASTKPYVVTNLTELSDEAFREAFPTASAAYLLDPDATRLDSIVEDIAGDDPLAASRRELKHYLLGPDEPDALTRFLDAIDAAYDRAVDAWPERPAPSVVAV